jgi:GH3 auxin-responsive promoter
MNIYNASEGFIGFQYNKEKSDEFVLLTNHDIFYECILLSDFRNGGRNAIPLIQIEIGLEYALVITTSGGLVRYIIGDTVRFISKSPYVFLLTGRTKQCLNTFGEEVVLENVESALSMVSQKLDTEIIYVTVAPVVLPNGTGYHSWCIECSTPPKDNDYFKEILDTFLRKLNSDYDAKRTDDLVLLAPKIHIVKQGTFLNWLESKGKLGGQHKVPIITDNQKMIQEILNLQK